MPQRTGLPKDCHGRRDFYQNSSQAGSLELEGAAAIGPTDGVSGGQAISSHIDGAFAGAYPTQLPHQPTGDSKMASTRFGAPAACRGTGAADSSEQKPSHTQGPRTRRPDRWADGASSDGSHSISGSLSGAYSIAATAGSGSLVRGLTRAGDGAGRETRLGVTRRGVAGPGTRGRGSGGSSKLRHTTAGSSVLQGVLEGRGAPSAGTDETAAIEPLLQDAPPAALEHAPLGDPNGQFSRGVAGERGYDASSREGRRSPPSVLLLGDIPHSSSHESGSRQNHLRVHGGTSLQEGSETEILYEPQEAMPVSPGQALGGAAATGEGYGKDDGGSPPVDPEIGSILSQAAAKAAGLPRTVGVVALAGLAFVTICAGPFGIEEAVRSSGPLPVAGTVVALAVLWGLPQALMCAELSTMIDENGGYVLWVDRAMGPFAAWMCAFNSLGSNMTDLPLYCILFASYGGVLVKEAIGMSSDERLPGWAVYLLKCGCLVVMTSLNLRNISSVGTASALVTCVILAPFVLEVGFAWKDQSLDDWTGVVSPIEWGTFTSTLLWNMQGWDSIGTMAGEVKDSARTYPLGIIIALVIITFTYVVPVLVGAGVEPDPSKWTEGALSVIAARVAPWLGVWVGLGAAAAQLGNGVAMMAASSRVTWQMSKSSMLPPQLGYMWEETAAPAGAVLMHGVTTAGLMLLPFSTLVAIDTIFNNVSLLLEGAAFLVLRYTEPDTMRPYEVPGGMVVAWIITISKTAVILFAIGTAGWVKWAACGGANVLFVAMYFVLERCKQSGAVGLPVGESRRLLEAKAASNLRRALVDVARGDVRAAEAASVGAVLGLGKTSAMMGASGNKARREEAQRLADEGQGFHWGGGLGEHEGEEPGGRYGSIQPTLLRPGSKRAASFSSGQAHGESIASAADTEVLLRGDGETEQKADEIMTASGTVSNGRVDMDPSPDSQVVVNGGLV